MLFALLFFFQTASATNLKGLADAIDKSSSIKHQCSTPSMPTFNHGFPFDLARHKCIFNLKEGYVAIGASVTAGQMGVSPIRVLMDAGGVRQHRKAAADHPLILDILNGFPVNAEEADFGTIFAIDLFYWPGRRGDADCRGPLQALDNLLQWTERNSVRLILGNSPDSKRPGDCTDQLNKAMNKCKDLKYCVLIDTVSKMKEIKENNGLKVGDTIFSLQEIRHDGLHLSRNGAILYAEDINKALDAKPLCK